uniref:Uncharacterized protein n=1 Tax=Brassica oleracea var. oleracea TaxID=109376 RepID=A0A0D3AM84_BRAOL
MMRPETTDFAEITESVNLIPLNLLAFTNTNTYLPDIVGQLTGIKSTFSEEAHSKGRVMATIKIQRLSLILISKRMYRVGFVCSMQWLLHFLKITELRPRPKGYCVNPKIVGGSYTYVVCLLSLLPISSALCLISLTFSEIKLQHFYNELVEYKAGDFLLQPEVLPLNRVR